mmetsp:Transcript_35374/g.82715  ORF Transcript_35374/g.82715 Transcript_35374/m.82715 type:complete len:226 (-) Transcript_35374:49-726(-)
MSHRSSQIARPYEKRIDAIDCRDLFNVCNRLGCFHLHDRADLACCLSVIVRVGSTVVVHSGQTHDPSYSLWRVARCCYCLPCLLSSIDIREEDALCAQVQYPLDNHWLIPRHADDWFSVSILRSLQLRQHIHDLVGTMLHVNHEPIHTRDGGQHFCHQATAQARPQADLATLSRARLDGCFEIILPDALRFGLARSETLAASVTTCIRGSPLSIHGCFSLNNLEV